MSGENSEYKELPQLGNIRFPEDFINPEMNIVGDEHINKLIGHIKPGNTMISTGDALVMLNELGFVEVYKLVAECEVDLPEWASAQGTMYNL